MQNKRKHHLALLICLYFILVSLFSLAYITVEADHDCTGEHCPVCVYIHTAEQTLRQLGQGITVTIIMMPDFVVVLAMLIPMLPILLCATLVSQRIRMNN